MAGVVVPIDGDVSPLLQKFAQIPGRTQAEMEAVGRVIEQEINRGRIAKAFADLPDVSAKEAKKAANMIAREMDRAARESERSFNEIKKGATVAFGGVVGDIEDVVGALSAMGPAALLVAGAAGIGAITVALYEAADASGALQEEQAALDASSQGLVNTIGTLASEPFARFLDGLRRVTDAANESLIVVGSLADTLTTDFALSIGILTTAIEGDERALRAWVKAYNAEDGYIEAARNALQATDDQTAALKLQAEALAKLKAANDAGKDKSIEIEKTLNEQIEKRAAMERTAIAESTRAKKEAERAAMVAAKEAEAERMRQWEAESAAAMWWAGKLEDAKDAEIERIAEIEKAWAAMDAKRTAAHEKILAQAEEERQKRNDVARSTLDAGLDVASRLAQAQVDGAEEGSEAQKKAAKAAFIIDQISALKSIAISTAEAVAAASPNPFLIAAALAIGAVQAGIVASTPAPSFHAGGTVGEGGGISSTAGLAEDERLIIAREGESVGYGGGPQSIRVEAVQVYRHQVLGRVLGDHVRLEGPLKRAIAGRRSPGRRNSRG